MTIGSTITIKAVQGTLFNSTKSSIKLRVTAINRLDNQPGKTYISLYPIGIIMFLIKTDPPASQPCLAYDVDDNHQAVTVEE